MEQLAFALGSPTEVEFENVFPEPLDCVVHALEQHRHWQDLLDHLPDIEPDEFTAFGLVVRRQGS
jgi:hypothetical protein